MQRCQVLVLKAKKAGISLVVNAELEWSCSCCGLAHLGLVVFKVHCYTNAKDMAVLVKAQTQKL